MSKAIPTPTVPNHADLVQAGVRWLRGYPWKCMAVFAEMQTKGTRIVPDVIGFRRYHSFLIECKTSKSDFRSDKEKRAAKNNTIPGELRWYLTPPGLLTQDEVPEGWGLLELRGRRIYCVLRAPKRVLTPEQRDVEMTILTSAVRRHEVGRHWDPSTAKFGRYKK